MLSPKELALLALLDNVMMKNPIILIAFILLSSKLVDNQQCLN